MSNNGDISVGVAVYNEENSILKCLSDLEKQLRNSNFTIYICLNGCSDRSLDKIMEYKRSNPLISIIVLESEKGKILAQNKIVQKIKKDNREHIPLLFVDADIVFEKDCIINLYRELFRIDQLKLVGAVTKPYINEKKRVWFYILNVRNFYPKSEVPCCDVSDYKCYAKKFPQPQIVVKTEQKSRIFVHGRCFMLKSADLYDVPADSNLADDTYLTGSIHYKFGCGTVRTIHSSVVHYKAYNDLYIHFKTYWRIYNDKKYIDANFPHLTYHRSKEPTTLDKKYIKSLSLLVRLQFFMHKTVIATENFIYKILPQKPISEIWKYESK